MRAKSVIAVRLKKKYIGNSEIIVKFCSCEKYI